MSNISVIISTYNNVDYIDESLSSIIDNTSDDLNIEILVGIDGCEKTKDYIEKNKEKYSLVKFFYFNKNVGPFVIKNTLINLVSYEKILFFDSDDILLENTIKKISDRLENNQYVQFSFLNFDENGLIKHNNVKYAEGVFAIRKSEVIRCNGFQPWRCGADTEFRYRYEKKGLITNKLNEILFHRRIHPNSLTRSPETGLESEFRRKIREEIKYLKFKNYPNPKILHVSQDFFEM